MSQTRTFLLELHCEEIPARFLGPLSTEFAEAFRAFTTQNGLEGPGGAQAEAFQSPRKLAWRVSNLLERQADQTETQVGPPQRMCVDEAGKPTVQGLKFAEKWGASFEQVRFEQPAGKKEPCAVLTLTKAGRPTVELLSETLPRLIAGLHVPKAMRWGHSTFTFVRPIRSILCLLGSQVVPFQVDGVDAGRCTWGHRLHHLDHAAPLELKDPTEYERVLEAAGVVAELPRRRELVRAQLDQLAAEAGGKAVEDEELLSTLAEIVEFPRILRGAFPESFLDLPKEVLVTSLKEHQKAFCVEDAQGALLPCFLTAANRPDDPAGHIRAGNEWVLRARLYDARFFFAEDRRHSLASRLEKLENLTFHRELGSYRAKSQRVAALAEQLAPRLGLDAAQAAQAAGLCKADLVTLMVGEFPELQGIMGGEYLRHEGKPEAVWMAVKEHYQPLSAEGPIPSTAMGCLLALCDKLDTVVGCFAIGQIPSGSKDPLALRRAGQGIVRILWERGWALGPMELCRLALQGLGDKATKPEADTLEALESFFRDRVAYQLELAAFPGAVRRAALPVGWSDLGELKARCTALAAFAEDPRFASLAQSAKRIANILKDEVPQDAFDPSVLRETEEQALAAHLAGLEACREHAALLEALAGLAQPLEAFFTAVMVKCEEPALRAARLSLLHRLRKAFLRMADLSVWQ